jgi:hypothetical protein
MHIVIWDERYLPCTFSAGDDTLRMAGIRLRGESSRGYPKKSYKVNFPPEARYNGRDKLNLISEWTDATFCREYLAYDLYRRAGLPAPEANFIRLFVNDKYLGLYLDVEQMDQRFLARNGFDPGSIVLKASENGTMLLPGEVEAHLWERETGDPADFRALSALIDWLSWVSDETFYESLDRKFDRAMLARAIAVNSLLGNTSTYYHNYYLIRPGGQTGRWIYTPWDVDYTFYYYGGFSQPAYCRSGHQTVGTNELIRRCWLHNDIREEIKSQMRGMIDSLFTRDYYGPLVDTLQALLRPAVAADTLKQYTVNDFTLLLGAFPANVAARGRRLIELVNDYPTPFDFAPVTVTPSGIFLSWDTAGDSSEVSYLLELSLDPNFFTVEMELPGVKATSFTFDRLPPNIYYARVTAISDAGDWLTALHQFRKFEVGEWSLSPIALPSEITGTTRLRPAQGVYQIEDTVFVRKGATLEIETGVTIVFGDSGKLVVEGELKTVTGSGDSVRFLPLDPERMWGGIKVGDDGVVELNRAIFRSGTEEESGDFWPSMIDIEGDSRVTLAHSTFELDYCVGILQDSHSSLNLTIDSCKFIGFFPALYLDGVEGIIRNTNFTNKTISSWYETIDFYGGSDKLEISGCRFFGGEGAIGLYNGYNSQLIENCWFEELSGEAIEVSIDAQIYIRNCIFLRTDYGIRHLRGDLRVSNCNFVQNIVSVVVSAWGSARIANSVFWLCARPMGGWQANSVSYCLSDSLSPIYGTGNIIGSPQFEKPWDGDFTPEPDSPLIDAGTSDGAPVTDFYGNRRVNTSGVRNMGGGTYRYYDIGAVEYPVGVATPPAMYGRELYCAPNPTNGATRIWFEIRVAGEASVGVFDLTGRELGVRNYPSLAAGTYSVDLSRLVDIAGIASGIYFVKLDQPAGVTTQKLAIIR